MTERICAVVVTYNRRVLLERCLDALCDQVRAPDAILVVDNAGSDGTPELLARRFPQVEVRRLARSLRTLWILTRSPFAARRLVLMRAALVREIEAVRAELPVRGRILETNV